MISIGTTTVPEECDHAIPIPENSLLASFSSKALQPPSEEEFLMSSTNTLGLRAQQGTHRKPATGLFTRASFSIPVASVKNVVSVSALASLAVSFSPVVESKACSSVTCNQRFISNKKPIHALSVTRCSPSTPTQAKKLLIASQAIPSVSGKDSGHGKVDDDWTVIVSPDRHHRASSFTSLSSIIRHNRVVKLSHGCIYPDLIDYSSSVTSNGRNT